MQSPIQTADRSRRAGCVCRGFFLGLALLFNGQAVWSQGVVPAIATPPPRPITLGSRTPEKEVEVQPGDTASGIGVLHLTDEASLDQMLVALLRLNPDVFLGYNVNRLPAGAILKIPDAEQIAAIPESEARRIIADQNREYAAFKAALAERSRTSSGDRIERSGTPVQAGPATPIQPRAAGAASEPVSPRSQAVIRDSDGLMGEGLHAPIPVGLSEQSLAGSLALRPPGVTAVVDSVTAPTRSPYRESGAPAVPHKPGLPRFSGRAGGGTCGPSASCVWGWSGGGSTVGVCATPRSRPWLRVGFNRRCFRSRRVRIPGRSPQRTSASRGLPLTSQDRHRSGRRLGSWRRPDRVRLSPSRRVRRWFAPCLPLRRRRSEAPWRPDPHTRRLRCHRRPPRKTVGSMPHPRGIPIG